MNRSVKTITTTRHFRRTLLLAVAAAPLALGLTHAWSQVTALPAAATTAPADATTMPATQPGITTTKGGGYILNFRDASADAVLEQLSEVAGFVVIKEYRPDKRVTLLSKQPVSAEEAVALLNTVLNDQGAAAILMGRELKIVARDKARKGSIPVHVGNDPTKIVQSDELITQVIPIRFADAVQLKADMAPLVSTDADFTANASSNTIIVTDTSANVRRVVEIISSLDTHIADAAEVKVFQLKYANATNTAKLINDIFKPSQTSGAAQGGGTGGGFLRRMFGGGGGGGGFGGGGFGGGGFGGGGAPGGGGGGGAPGGAGSQGAHTAAQVNASSDDRTNTVVVTGPADTLEVVARVIKEIDSNPVAQQSVFIYNLKNGQAQNIAVVLNNLLNGTSQTIGSNSNSRSSSSSIGSGGRTGGGGAGGTSGLGSSTPIQRNGFGANGSSTTGGGSSGGGLRGGGLGGFGQGGLSSTAAQAADQLAGEVTVVANPDTNSLLVMTSPKNFDQVKTILNELDRPVPQVLIKVLIAEVTHEDSTDLGAEFSWMNIHLKPNGISPSGNSEQSSTVLGAPSQGYFATITEDHLSATIHALESKSKVDVLSRPYILTSDNQLATVTVGQNVPYPTNSTTDINGGTHTSITYANIGIILNVTPHINSDGLVILDVNPEVSSISDSVIQITQGLNASVFNIRSADSRVGVIDGQTIVIGGLMADNLNQTTTQVPILGDIPIIGNFFKRDIHDKTKTELLFFLTPHVAPKPEVLKAMAADEMKGTKLTPNAVGPGVFKEHMEGMQRGSTTQESTTQPAEK